MLGTNWKHIHKLLSSIKRVLEKKLLLCLLWSILFEFLIFGIFSLQDWNEPSKCTFYNAHISLLQTAHVREIRITQFQKDNKSLSINKTAFITSLVYCTTVLCPVRISLVSIYTNGLKRENRTDDAQRPACEEELQIKDRCQYLFGHGSGKAAPKPRQQQLLLATDCSTETSCWWHRVSGGVSEGLFG